MARATIVHDFDDKWQPGRGTSSRREDPSSKRATSGAIVATYCANTKIAQQDSPADA
ncbi:MAG TPA: hypothetical protein VKA54_16675 [Gemmatimonadaceae bacterium]|nr:hypothetical protein [Gemmatimonadaceae bacterium]